MKTSTGNLQAYLAAIIGRTIPPETLMADCFTFTLQNGNQYRYTNADTNVSFYDYDATNETSGALGLGSPGAMILAQAGEAPIATFLANTVRIGGLKYSVKIGVDVDEQDVTISCVTPPVYAQSPDAAQSGVLDAGELGAMTLSAGPYNSPAYGASQELVEGVPFLQALRQGLFDYAYLQRDRAFLPAWGAPPIGAVTLFHGRVSSIDKIGRTEAQMKVKSDLVLLDIDFPRNLYQATCGHILYDAGCTLNKASFAVTGVAGTGSTNQIIAWANSEPADYFDQGTIRFTSGVLANLTATVKDSSSSSLTIAGVLPVAPQPGDTFDAYPGCDHTTGANGCAKFSNLAHFRGYPRVPPPSTAY